MSGLNFLHLFFNLNYGYFHHHLSSLSLLFNYYLFQSSWFLYLFITTLCLVFLGMRWEILKTEEREDIRNEKGTGEKNCFK